MIPISFSTASGRSCSANGRWWRSAAFSASSSVSKGKRRIASSSTSGVRVARDPEEAHELLVPRLDQRLDRAALREDLLHLVHLGDVVDLPEVEVIGLQQLERLLEVLERAVARAVVRLAREEDLAPAALHDLADVPLAPALFLSAVARGGIDVVDAQVDRALDDRDRDRGVVGLLDGGLTARGKRCRPCSRCARDSGPASPPRRAPERRAWPRAWPSPARRWT